MVSAFIIGVFLTAYLLTSKQQSPQQQVTIQLNEMGFSPQKIEVNQGDTVVFTTNLQTPFWPASDLHPTHEIYSEFDPQEPIEPDKSWSFQFNKVGTWNFHDHLNPFFRGQVIVKRGFVLLQ